MLLVSQRIPNATGVICKRLDSCTTRFLLYLEPLLALLEIAYELATVTLTAFQGKAEIGKRWVAQEIQRAV